MRKEVVEPGGFLVDDELVEVGREGGGSSATDETENGRRDDHETEGDSGACLVPTYGSLHKYCVVGDVYCV